MRQFFLAFLFVGLVFFTTAQAQTINSASLLKQLLDLPAPPPVDDNWNKFINTKTTERDKDFFDKNRVPPDDAPISDLLEYWSMQSGQFRQLRYNVRPSERTLERILEYCKDNPDTLILFLNILPTKPKIAEFVKEVYDKKSQAETPDYSVYQFRNWLLYHSDFFVDELVKKAEKVKDKNEYVTNQPELLALARVDWDKAAPILERLVNDTNQPISAALAKWAYYLHALETEDESDITKYRRLLQDVVEDKKMPAGARDLALDALVSEKEWDGRDDWYLSLLSDETLYELKVNGQTYTGLTTLMLYSPPEKYVKAMAALVDNKNPTIRKAAIKNLLTFLSEPNIDAVRALLPWLSNPNWATDNQNARTLLVSAVGRVDLPESIPSLITILMNEPELRIAAAEALAKYKDSRAVPTLKTVLQSEIVPYRRIMIINALDECGGLSDDEKMSALEAYATAISTPEGAEKVNLGLGYYDTPEESRTPVPLTLSIGKFVADQTEPSDGLAFRALERLKALRKTKPAVAAALAEIIRSWKGRVIFIERLRQIRAGEADLETILAALANRKEIRESVENDVFALRSASGIGRGIAACLAEDNADLLSVLRQTNADAQIAMLGCARILRAKLPVAETSALLKSSNKLLALAAERYLESEDSLEARTILLAQRPNEARILGARLAFIPDPKNISTSDSLTEIFQSITGRPYLGGKLSYLDKSEENLQNEIKTNPDLMVIFGILPNAASGQQIIRVFKDKIVYTNYEDEARYRERTLTAKEYEEFYRLLMDEKIDLTPPIFGYGDEGGANEFVMFGKNGGRRVFFVDYLTDRPSIKKLLERFASFNEGNLKLHYRLADKIKGLEVLLADNKFTAYSVWKNGSDLRVLVADKEREVEIAKNLNEQFQAENSVEIDEDDYVQIQQRRESQEKRRMESRYAHFFWRNLENGTLGGVTSQPSETPFLIDENQVPEIQGFSSNTGGWKARAGNSEIRISYYTGGSLYKVSRSQSPVEIKKGRYSSPIVSGDENWVIVSKGGENWDAPNTLVRINLKTNKEFPVNLQPADTIEPIAFVPSHNKVLVYRAKGRKYYEDGEQNDEESDETPVVQPDKNDKNPSPAAPEYYLLDAATGTTQPVKGEFQPLKDLTYRPLQSTGKPDEFWAAIYDKKAKETAVGRYNTKTFTFQAVTKFPEISLNSMDIWVDEKESKVYFVYQGHVLAAPLQSPQK